MEFSTKRHITADTRVFIVFLIVVSIPYFLLGNLILKSFERTYYRAKATEAYKFTAGYIKSLDFAYEASDIIGQLLDEKVAVTSELVALHPDIRSEKTITNLLDNLHLDQVFLYNPSGEILYSGTKEYIGWQAPVGHPVHRFMTSGETSLVEPLRPDTESGEFYKYGYFKTPDGYFVQLGIRADKIHDFLDTFDMRSLLLQMAEDEDARQVCLLDDRFTVFLSTEERLLGTDFAHTAIIAAITTGERYSRLVELDGDQLFQTFIPIARHGITAMAVTFSLDDIVQFRKNLLLYGMLVMVSMYLFVISLLFATHIKERRLQRMAYIDSNTGLPNRNFLVEYLDRNLKDNSDRERYLILIRCLNFEEVYAAQGLSTREELVAGIAKLLQRIILGDWGKEHGLLSGSRLLKEDHFEKKLFIYDDETFAIFTKDMNSDQELIRFLQLLNTTIADGIAIAKERIIPVWVKYGIGRLEQEARDPQILLQNILLALRKPVKGEINYHFFTSVLAESKIREDELAQELQEAIATSGSTKLWLAYQPQFDLKNGKLVGFESLARFNSTKYGFVPPNEFIAIAEEKHLIITLGEHILRRVCMFIREMEDLGYPDIIVAVNISLVQLLRSDFVELVLGIVEEYGINKNALELEITETIFFEDFEKLNATIRRLATLGFSLALDDFGVGYSSLARLKELDFDIIKVDRLFTQKIMGNEPEHLIYPDIISMAHRLGLKVIAEGVEYTEQAEFLQKYGCDMVQGYLFGKPIPKHEAAELLLKSR